jgi:uncharacterized protein YndB with AHSA1/START domain
MLDVRLEEVLPHPVERVWAALTEAASISDWLMITTDFRAEVGARFRLKTGNLAPSGWVEAEVVDLDPPRRMTWAWSVGDGNEPTLVTFELTPDGSGTRLSFTHTGEIDAVIGDLLSRGWSGRLEILRRTLD